MQEKEEKWAEERTALANEVAVLKDEMPVLEQREQALVLQFGEPKRVIQEPGLFVKIPVIQDVVLSTIEPR